MNERSTYRVWFCNLNGCAHGISDIDLTITVLAASEAEALSIGLQYAGEVNDSEGMPPHGIKVSGEELRELACVMPANESSDLV